MPTPGSFRPRQTRIRRYAGAIAPPTMWFEIHGPLNVSPTFADHPIWALPNTYPLLRMDLQLAYASDGSYSYAFLERPPTPFEFATNLNNLYTAYESAYGARFSSVGKPMRFGLLLAGLGVTNGPLQLTNDSHDIEDRRRQRPWSLLAEQYKGQSRGRMRRNRTTQGVTPKIGCDNSSPYPRAAFFHKSGREQLKAWAIPAFQQAASSLIGPPPELLLSDAEPYFQQIAFGSEADLRTGYVSPSTRAYDRSLYAGWYDQLVNGYPLQPQWFDYPVDGAANVGEWLTHRANTLDGSPVRKHNPRYYASNPAENDRYQIIGALLTANFIESVNQGIFNPARSAFGPALKCGQYGSSTTGRVYPSELRPTLPFYAANGDIGLDFQSPSDYFSDGNAHDGIYPLYDADVRWDIENAIFDYWRGRLQQGGASITEVQTKWYLEKYSAGDWGAARSSTVPLFPATSVTLALTNAVFEAMFPSIVEWHCRAVMAGARNIWMFEPEFNQNTTFGASLRPAVLQVTEAALGRLQAASTRRNRQIRGGNISYPYLAVNK